MWGGGAMWVRSDVTSGCNWRWERCLDAGDAEDGKTTSKASGRGAHASGAGLIFADPLLQLNLLSKLYNSPKLVATSGIKISTKPLL